MTEARTTFDEHELEVIQGAVWAHGINFLPSSPRLQEAATRLVVEGFLTRAKQYPAGISVNISRKQLDAINAIIARRNKEVEKLRWLRTLG